MPYAFTYFRAARPAAHLTDQQYAGVHARQTQPTAHHEAETLADLADALLDYGCQGRKGDAGYIVAGHCRGPRSEENTGPAGFALIDYDNEAPDWDALDLFFNFAS